jgi:crotonobetainyl-CoA:carnitine CoA-transferase CaiB-like acyl-CoA transferase
MDTPHLPDADVPLAGIRVLDLSRLLPGPYCSLLLTQLGAEVIKVETPLAGDYARMAPPELGFGGVFEALNCGKRSIAVDYRKPRGRDLVLELARSADVLIESSRPGRLDRCGLGAVDVRAANPRLVYCSISGFGQYGPHRDVPGHDIDYLASSGVLSLLGQPTGAPVPPGLQLADVSTGMVAATRICAALAGRSATGRGTYLDVAAIDGPVSWLGTLGAGVAGAGLRAGPMSGACPCYGTYRAADGRWLAVGALEVQFWRAFCEGLGREDLISRQFDPDAIEQVAVAIGGRTSTEWLARFDEDACVALVKLPAEALEDPYVRARGVGRTSGTPAPRLGADTEAVLAEAGVEPDLVERLTRSGVVSGVQSAARAARAARLGAMLARRGRSVVQHGSEARHTA